jgi:hypothetical protein
MFVLNASMCDLRAMPRTPASTWDTSPQQHTWVCIRQKCIAVQRKAHLQAGMGPPPSLKTPEPNAAYRDAYHTTSAQ